MGLQFISYRHLFFIFEVLSNQYWYMKVGLAVVVDTGNDICIFIDVSWIYFCMFVSQMYVVCVYFCIIFSSWSFR